MTDKLRILPALGIEEGGDVPSVPAVVTTSLKRVAELALKIGDVCEGYDNGEIALAMASALQFRAAQQAVADFVEGLQCQTQRPH